MPEEESHTLYKGGSLTPVPDPTVLTTQALHREILALRELFGTRLDAIDRATKLFEENLTRVPTETTKQVTGLRELVNMKFEVHEEKFKGIATQFAERDKNTEKIAELNQKAIDAALQAAKEAVSKQQEFTNEVSRKMEATFSKQSDEQGRTLTTATSSLRDLLDGVKERVGLLEGRVAQNEGRGGGMEKMWGFVVGAIGTIIALASFAYSLTKR